VIGEAVLLGARVPIAGVAGDQQAALFGQGCFASGEAKATYGTGTFVLAALGEGLGTPAEGLLTTAAAVPPGRAPQYAAEGAVLVGGAARPRVGGAGLQWLRDGLGVIESAAESERLATSVESTDGVVFVPALTGLGSPQWQAHPAGVISGVDPGPPRAEPRP